MAGFSRQRFSAHRYLLLPGVTHFVRITHMVNYTAIFNLTKCFKRFFIHAFTHEGDKNGFIQRSCLGSPVTRRSRFRFDRFCLTPPSPCRAKPALSNAEALVRGRSGPDKAFGRSRGVSPRASDSEATSVY